MGAPSLIEAPDRVLSTLNADGSRRWLNPKLVKGAMWKRRKIVGWLLIAIFVTLPHIHFGGRQAFLIDIANGEFTLFGMTFVRTDTLLLALGVVSIFVTVFLLTALLGRVWCGWACPQTVYLDFVFRPIDRMFDGKTHKKGFLGVIAAMPTSVRAVTRIALMLLVSFILANTFLSYFVGSRTLLTWITDWPWIHPVGFGIVTAVTVAMMVDFAFFREQLCIVACPYGRFQSVMLDKQSLIVGYDAERGEPRGKVRRRPAGDDAAAVSLPQLGDCVSCTKCVQVCPTGIDIRDGLQLECIHCAACVDACNEVMTKLGRATGLIRYSSQQALETGRQSFFRARVVLYPLILVALATAIGTLIATKQDAEVMLIRGQGLPFYVMDSGEIANQFRVRVYNRTDETASYTVRSLDEGVRVVGLPEGGVVAGPGATVSESARLVAEPSVFAGAEGRKIIRVEITDGDALTLTEPYRLLGPSGR